MLRSEHLSSQKRGEVLAFEQPSLLSPQVGTKQL